MGHLCGAYEWTFLVRQATLKLSITCCPDETSAFMNTTTSFILNEVLSETL